MKLADNAKESSEFAAIESQLTDAALKSVMSIETFYELLTMVGGEPRLAWEPNLSKNKISRAAGERMLRDRLERIIPALRERMYPLVMRGLDIPRASALVHLAAIVGCDRLNENSALWKALAKKDYKEAYRAFMLTEWPASNDAEVKKRMPTLALTIYTGTAQ